MFLQLFIHYNSIKNAYKFIQIQSVVHKIHNKKIHKIHQHIIYFNILLIIYVHVMDVFHEY
jgi:hypothetical protein